MSYSFVSPSEGTSSFGFSDFPSGATLIFPSKLSISGFGFLLSDSSFSGAKAQTLPKADFNFFLAQG